MTTIPTTGQNRANPLKPPKPLFFTDPNATQADTSISTKDVGALRQMSSSQSNPRSPTSPLSPDVQHLPAMQQVHRSRSQTADIDQQDTESSSNHQTNGNPFSPPASIVSFSAHNDSEEAMSIISPGHSTTGSIAGPFTAAGSRTSSFLEIHPRSTGIVRPMSSSSSMPNSPGLRKSFASPPTRPVTMYNGNQGHLSALIATNLAGPKRAKSTMLTGEIEKPWLGHKDPLARMAYWLTYLVAFIGIAASALRCWFAYTSVPMMKGNLCLILEDDFNGDSLNTDIWEYEVTMGGFGNGEFEMTTDSSNNTFLRDGYLYILPTLTSDVIGRDAITNGYTYNITGCTTATSNDSSTCGAVSNNTAGTVINPAMSARLNTKKSRSIQYGRVEIRAKNPVGDWLWPAVWMLPVNNTYGPWPMSGEIDIMESRGNGLSYTAQGSNYVHGSLNWGPLTWLNEVWRTTGWWTERRSSFADAFHTYALEWDEDFIRVYVDTRLHGMLQVNMKVPFFERGDFPPVVTNGTEQIALENPWVYGTKAAPFDIPFYLIMNVAVGGTNGWFPDNAGDKPWINGASNAMQQFAQAQDKWATTWPQDEYSRALVVDYVKMWQKC